MFTTFYKTYMIFSNYANPIVSWFQLTPGETFEHSCGLLFLYEGEYMIDISCSANRKFGTPTPKRQRAFAIGENAPNSPNCTTSDKKLSWTTPLSPNSVSKKLKYHEADFWAQTFVLNVASCWLARSLWLQLPPFLCQVIAGSHNCVFFWDFFSSITIKTAMKSI